MLNECLCSSHPPRKSCPIALVEGRLGSSCGLRARLCLGWKWSISSSFWSPPRSRWLSSLSITWQILLTRLQEMQVEDCSPDAQSPALGKLGGGRGIMGSSGELPPSPAEVCWLGGALSSPNLLSWLQVRKKEKQTKKESFTCK